MRDSNAEEQRRDIGASLVSSIGYYGMQGGSLLNVACPSPGPDNPFTGNVSFTGDVFFPRERNTYILPDAQPYRNMRYICAASKMRKRLTSSIYSQTGSRTRERLVDESNTESLYEWMSDFGSSALRVCVAGRAFRVVVFLICVGRSSQGSTSKLVGWQQVLIDPRFWGDWAPSSLSALHR